MDPFSGSGSWNIIPTMLTHSNSPAHSNQDNLFLSPQHQPQQFYQQQQQQQPQFPQQPPPQFSQQQQHIQQQQKIQPRTLQPQSQQQTQHHQSLASHFHLLHLVENLADAIENGTRDQHSDA